MSRTHPIVLSLFLLVASATPINAAPVTPSSAAVAHDPDTKARDVEHGRPQRVTDRLIVQWKQPKNSSANELARGLSRVESIHGANGPSVVRPNGPSVEKTVKQLSADPAVAWVEPDYLMQVDAVAVNDPLSSQQYSLDQMRVRDAWSLTKGGSRLIAVLDTGVQFNHPDLVGRISSGGYDFVNRDTNPSEDNGHGTWVSGIIAANPNNGRGAAGISWTDKILPVKVMDAQGYGYSSDIALGIDYAVSKGAKIINMSIGGFEYSLAVKAAVDRAWAAGSVLVAAAGNYRSDQPSYPASFDHVVSVSATQADDEFANWSNYGRTVDVAAPGTAVTTTNCNACNGWGDYTAISGTSFATPNTAAVIALIMAKYPAYTNAQVVDRLLSTTDDLGFPGWDDRYGRGRVNAYRAVGGSPAKLAAQTGDSLERNDSSTGARALSFGAANPTIYPAGDVDYFSFSAPRAGRIDLAVTPVIDTSRTVKSALSVDPVLEVWVNGVLLKTVDDPNSSATVERVSYQASGPMKITLGVRNWLPNGSRTGYPLKSAFVDNVKPIVTARTPGSVTTDLQADVLPTATFSEAVTDVSASTFTLRDAGGALVAATVGYDSSQRRAWLRPTTPFSGETSYTLTATSGVKDVAGNALSATSWSFTTGKVEYRLYGTDRYATAAAISAASFNPGVPVAYLATGANFPDALAGAPAAAVGRGPLLLTRLDSLPAVTGKELTRIRPGRIVVLGSTAVISETLRRSLAAYTSGSVTRLAGVDRYATAAAISAASFSAGVPVVYLATGEGFPDALAGGAAAARSGGGPVLLTRANSLPPATAAELSRLKPGRIVVLGSSGVISESLRRSLDPYTGGSVTRLAGVDRYATAVAISAATVAPGVPVVYLATGVDFPDGLSAGPVAGPAGAPLLLTRPTSLPDVVSAELQRLNPSTVVVLGSSGAVSDSVIGLLADLRK